MVFSIKDRNGSFCTLVIDNYGKIHVVENITFQEAKEMIKEMVKM